MNAFASPKFPVIFPNHSLVPLSLTLLTASVLVWGAAGANGEEEVWYKWRGPHGDGISRESVPKSGAWPQGSLEIRWKNNVGIGFSSPVIKEGRLFLSGNQHDRDTIYCLDSDSGKTLWKHSYASEIWPNLYDGGPNATVSIDGNRAFAVGRHGHVFCFEAATGKVIWEINLHEDLGLAKPSWGFTSAPLVDGDLLYLNAGTHGLALEKSTGKVRWQTGEGDGAYATPEPIQLGNEKALVVFGATSCSAVKAGDGALLWETPWKTKYKVNAAQPIIHNGQMFLSSAYGFGCALFDVAPNGVKEVWRNQAMENHFATCVLIDGFLYGVSGTTADKCVLKCVVWETGETKWVQKGVGLGTLIAAKDQLVILSDRGELIFAPASPEAFKPAYRSQILGGKCWSPPAISEGVLYARNAKGDVVAVELP